MKKVSCIVSAYNEEPRISGVLKVLVDSPIVDEVIVTDDCSTDNTIREILKFKNVKLIRHKKNMGKARSMIDGCKKAKNDLVMFIDADLVGLTDKDITRLAKPVIDGLVDLTLAMWKNSFFLYNQLNKLLGHDYISGERVLKRNLALKSLKDVKGYGAEVKINQYILDHKLKFLVVRWPNVTQILKQKKVGFVRGCVQDIAMSKQLIFHTLPFFKVLKQMLIMGVLSARYKKELKLDKNLSKK